MWSIALLAQILLPSLPSHSLTHGFAVPHTKGAEYFSHLLNPVTHCGQWHEVEVIDAGVEARLQEAGRLPLAFWLLRRACPGWPAGPKSSMRATRSRVPPTPVMMLGQDQPRGEPQPTCSSDSLTLTVRQEASSLVQISKGESH